MAILLVVSALLLDFLGCAMPLSWIVDTRGIKAGVFLIWLALAIVAVLMGLLHRDELTGVNPLLTAGLESICLVCAIYPLFGRRYGLDSPQRRPNQHACRPCTPRSSRGNRRIWFPAFGNGLAHIFLARGLCGPAADFLPPQPRRLRGLFFVDATHPALELTTHR